MTNNPRVESDIYDRGITPAETAARKEREGEAYKHTPQSEGDEHIHTADGYTVDREGLLNNYAIEPEMYYEVPGDARQEIEEDIDERAEELHDINDNNEAGLLTEDHDSRGKGSGIV